MKKIFYLFSAAFMALAIGCTDDEIIKQGSVFPVDENEVPFGAGEGVFNTGEKSAKGRSTRTIYEVAPNSTFETYTELIVSWKAKDPIRVFSPEAPAGYQTADYEITAMPDPGEDKYGKGGFLMKVGENGIHWGVSGNQPQRFFAFYPGDDTHLPDKVNNLKTSGKFTHTIPVAQEKGVEVSYDSNTGQLIEDLSGKWKIISPDMTFCNMVAEATCSPDTTDLLKLQFYPLVTVLDVVITGGETSYDILGVSIKSKTQDIVGTYTFDFEKPAGQRITFNDSSSEENKTAYIDCMHGQTPLRLESGSNLNVKFFLLPRDINANELSIEVLCEGGYVLKKSLNKDVTLKAGKVIKIRTPKIKLGETNNWMSMIDDNVYFASQLSLPGAKHAYSYTTLDESGNVYPAGGQKGMGAGDKNKIENPTIDPNYNRETGIMPFYQTLPIEQLFNSGVRAFDIKVITENGKSMIFAAGKETKTSLQEFLTKLKGLIGGDTTTATEGVVVNINFAYANNSSQDDWVNQIMKDVQSYDNDGSTLCKVSSETIMKEMRGKIGIMVHYNGNTNYQTKYIGILKGFDTSVQNTENTTLQLGKTGQLHLQNLYQVNNPEITGNIDGVRDGVGLCPHFILQRNVEDGTSSVDDLIAKKKYLLQQLLEESQKGNAALTELFMNDLSGFCVVNDNESTGWGEYKVYTYEDKWGSWLDGWNEKTYQKRDPKKLPTNNTTKPTHPKDGEMYFEKVKNGGAPEKGQGGNTALFAEKINTYAREAIYNIVEQGRAPLGIVYMNFAGVRTLTVGGKQYSVNGINLPSMIMSNNFKFALKKKDSTSAQ